MLLQYGNTIVDYDWIVEERIPAGYSRVYYVYGGEVLYEDDQCERILESGHLYIFPSASPYRMTQNPQNRLNCTFIHIDVFPTLITDLIDIPVEDYPLLNHLLVALTASIISTDDKVTIALSDVFEIYCREHGFIISTMQKMSNILLYIAENIGQNMTIEELSKMAGYNEEYFIRFFKQNVGLTPHQYIMSYRLKEAKILLKTTATITEIARITGYSDIKSFSRSFKKFFNMSPSHYKNVYIIQP